MVRFSWLTGDVNWETYGGKWISNRQNNGEFDYWFVIEFINWIDAVGEREAPAKYNVTLSVVSPQKAGVDNLRRAMESCGVDECFLSRIPEGKARQEVIVELLHSYGVSVPVWSEDGDNRKSLVRQARRESQVASGLFGFVMDRPVNRIGATGWEALRGDMMDSALARAIGPEADLMRKMHNA